MDERKTYEVTLVSGKAEGCCLVEADSAREAMNLAAKRAIEGEVCWEGESGPTFEIIGVKEVVDD